MNSLTGGLEETVEFVANAQEFVDDFYDVYDSVKELNSAENQLVKT